MKRAVLTARPSSLVAPFSIDFGAMAAIRPLEMTSSPVGTTRSVTSAGLQSWPLGAGTSYGRPASSVDTASGVEG
ncbi:MAG: hypothetical protein GY698_08715 [Actinomycetia bacterium]|nr:hypothetical protein [Actinomycetes bacterium]